MTFAEMVAEVFLRLRTSASASVFWTTADVKRALNDGWEELADATEWYEIATRIPFLEGCTYYDLRNIPHAPAGMRIDEFDRAADGVIDPADRLRFSSFGFSFSRYGFSSFLVPIAIRVGKNDRWTRPADIRTLDYLYRLWELNQGTPQWAFMRGIFWLGLWPKPMTDGGPVDYVDLYHTAIPSPLVNDWDEPDFPVEIQDVLVEYALYDLLIQDREMKKAAPHWEAYLQKQEAFRRYVHARPDRDRVYRFAQELPIPYEGPHVRGLS